MPAVLLEVAEDLATLTINRPDARNAISLEIMGLLETALNELEAAPPSVVVVRGAGDRAFVSGGDLKDLADLRTLDQASAMSRRMRSVLDRLAGLASLTIAAINGDAIGGGGEVALACDLRIAADDVLIAFSQSQLAIMPAWGGIERLTTTVGRSQALSLLLTPRRLTAPEALAVGLVDEVVVRAGFDHRVAEVARGIARLPRHVVTEVGAVVNAVSPAVSPATSDRAVAGFATAWVDDAHWEAVDRAHQARAKSQA